MMRGAATHRKWACVCQCMPMGVREGAARKAQQTSAQGACMMVTIRLSLSYLLSHHIGKPSSSGKALLGSATPASSNAVGSQSETWKSPARTYSELHNNWPFFCIWIGIGRPVSLRCAIKRLGSSENGLKFEHRRVSKPFLRFSSWPW